MIHISFLWEPDVNVEELREVAKEDAVQGGGRAAEYELLCAEQLGDGVEVFERHLPDFRFCVPSNPLQVRPEYVMLFHYKKNYCEIWHLRCTPDFGHGRLEPAPVGHRSWQIVVFTKLQ